MISQWPVNDQSRVDQLPPGHTDYHYITVLFIIVSVVNHHPHHYYHHYHLSSLSALLLLLFLFGLEALYRPGASQALLQQGHRARGGLQPDCSKRRGKLANGVASQKSCPTHLSHV